MRLSDRARDGTNLTAWYNGHPIEETSAAPLDNVGLRFGATVFTTMRVHKNSLEHPLTLWEKHCDRLQNSLTQFGWTEPNWPDVKAGAQHLIDQYAVLRITLFPDGREWITGRTLPTELSDRQHSGISAWVAPSTYQRSLPTHKTGNYLACWLAKKEAQKFGASEAILISPQGEWLETTTGNLWGWKDGHWWTPKCDRCLPGLMRDWLIERLSAEGHVVDCRPWDAELALGFEAIAYSNCVVQLLPIGAIVGEGDKLSYDAQHASIKALRDQIVAAEDFSPAQLLRNRRKFS